MTQPGVGEPLRKIKLTDNASTSYELILQGGDSSINETFLSPNPITPGGSGKFGDFDPGFGFVSQSDWSRGFGSENLSEDTSRFYDGESLWSATPNILFPNLKWYWADGLKLDERNEADDINFSTPAATTGAYEYATPFTCAANIDVKYIYMWVYTADATATGAFSVKLYDDSSGDPNTELGETSDSYTVAADIPNLTEAKLLRFSFTGTVSLTASTAYHVVFVSAHKHIRPGREGLTGSSKISLDSWSTNAATSQPDLVFRCIPTYAKRTMKPFILQQALYAIAEYVDGTDSKLYINGDRGKATAGASTTITDSNEGLRGAWTANQWANAKVKIIEGLGKGQIRTISENDTNGVLTVSSAWDTNPDATSLYVIVDTNDWAEIDAGGTGIGDSIGFCVVNDVVYFSKGYGNNIRRAYWNSGASPPAMAYADDGTNDADVLGVAAGYVWRGTNDDGKVAKAPIKTWGTNLTFTNMDEDTGTDYNFSSIIGHGQQVFIFKKDSIWYCDPTTTTLYEYPINLKHLPDSSNGTAVATMEEYLFFNWGHALERLSGLTVDHLDPNRGQGMPTNYQGDITAIAPHPAGVFFTVNAGTQGTSGVYLFDGAGFHIACRPPTSPRGRMRSLLWQPIDETRPILWIGWEDELIFQKYPQKHTNPLKDTGCVFEHQFSVITSTIDMGAAGLKKMFRDIDVVFKNFNYWAAVFYQKDTDIGSTTWTYVGYYSAVTDEVNLFDATLSQINALGNIKQIRLKIVVQTTDGTDPPQISAIVLKGFGRTPTRKQWSLIVSLSETMENLGSGDPNTFMTWLDTKAENAEALLMESEHPRLHNKTVILIPRSMRTAWIDANNESFSGALYLEVREA